MAADGTPGPKGNPQYLGAGAPATAADQNEISTWAANNIDRRVADTAARDAIPLKYVGMIVQTADNNVWLCTASGGSGTWLWLREDTGWQTLTLAVGASVSGGLTPQIRRLNGVAHVHGQMTANGAGGCFTVPAGFIIGQTERRPVLSGTSGAAVAALIIATDGSVSTSAGALINCNTSWPIG